MIKQRLRRVESLLQQADRAALPPRPLQNVQDVVDLLQEQVDALRRAPWIGTLDKARAIGYLAGVARHAIEAGKLAARVEMLELVLKQRADSRR